MDKGAVFITGASTGIGRASVDRLAADGFTVIAGVRRDGDAPQSAAGHVLVDVAEPESISRACKEVLTLTDGKLAGLVNNAGVTVSGPFETLSMDDWRRQFEVNFFGHLAVTQELLPTLLASGGRIVTVGSVGGRFSVPFLGPYSASKFAIRAWMDALRHELSPHGVKAVLVEPGAIRTEIWRKGNEEFDTLLEGASAEQRARYAPQIDGARKAADLAERHAIPAEKCAAVISSAMTARNPRGRYLVGVDARLQATVAAAPTRLSDRIVRLLVSQPKSR